MTTLEASAFMKHSARELSPLRVLGVFPQRQEDAFMARVRIPCGVLTSSQLDAVADVVETYSARGRAHFTMRQDIQIYDTSLESRPGMEARLEQSGLTLREAGGNVVRNVTCCAYAGTTPGELFDPTPYALALARHFHGRTDVLCVRDGREITPNTLPRKLKFAVGGCCDGTCGNTAINDLGFLTTSLHGTLGFRVTVAGGLSAKPRIADELISFIPAGEILTIAEAVVRVFAQYGSLDPSSKRSARLRHLVARMGVSWMRDQVDRACAQLRGVPLLPPAPPTPALKAPAHSPALPSLGTSGDTWAKQHVRATTRPDIFACHAANLHGDLSPTQLRALARIGREFSADDCRLTSEQGILFRQVEGADIPKVWAALQTAGLTPAAAGASVTACPGLASCKYAIADTRAISRRLDAWLAANASALADAGPIRFRVSGCPFSCGHHHVGTIGFYGTARTVAVGGRITPVPLAAMTLGGNLSATDTHLAQGVLGIPPRKIPAALDRLLALYHQTRAPAQLFADWSQHVDVDLVRKNLADLSVLDPHDPELVLDLQKSCP